jgi:hypothetical protein
MASSIEMMRRARLRKQLNKKTQLLESTATTLTTKLAPLFNQIEFYQGICQDVRDFVFDFAREYHHTSLHKRIDFEDPSAFFKIKYNNQSAGFVVIRNQMIDIVYIRPEFRGVGIATLVYSSAIRQMGCDSISLSTDRCEDKMIYWQALGFRYFRCEGLLMFDKQLMTLSLQPLKGSKPFDQEHWYALKTQHRKLMIKHQMIGGHF